MNQKDPKSTRLLASMLKEWLVEIQNSTIKSTLEERRVYFGLTFYGDSVYHDEEGLTTVRGGMVAGAGAWMTTS